MKSESTYHMITWKIENYKTELICPGKMGKSGYSWGTGHGL